MMATVFGNVREYVSGYDVFGLAWQYAEEDAGGGTSSLTMCFDAAQVGRAGFVASAVGLVGFSDAEVGRPGFTISQEGCC